MPPEQQPFTPFAPEGTVPQSVPPAPTRSFVAQGTSEDEKYSTTGWSWGAFMFGPMFLIAVRKYKQLWLYAIPLLFPLLLGLLVVGQSMYGDSSPGGIYGAVLPIIIVSIGIAILFFIALPIYFGIKGRMLAAESRTFSNKDQYVGFMKVMDHAGKVGFFLTLGFLMLGFVFLIVTQSILPQGSSGNGGYDEYESTPYDFEDFEY